MSRDQEFVNLEQLLEQIGKASQNGDQVYLGAILDVIGRRSFGPLLLLAGLITLAPVIGDIPGVPTIMGIIVFLISIQLIFHRKYFWLPDFLLNRSVARDKLRKTLKWMQTPAQYIDRFLRPRLQVLTEDTATYIISIVCLFIAILMPVMELIPFSANAAGAALTTFGLSIIAKDGLLALIAFLFTAITAGVVIYNFL